MKLWQIGLIAGISLNLLGCTLMPTMQDLGPPPTELGKQFEPRMATPGAAQTIEWPQARVIEDAEGREWAAFSIGGARDLEVAKVQCEANAAQVQHNAQLYLATARERNELIHMLRASEEEALMLYSVANNFATQSWLTSTGFLAALGLAVLLAL